MPAPVRIPGTFTREDPSTREHPRQQRRPPSALPARHPRGPGGGARTGWVVTSSYSSWGCPGSGVSYTITDTAGQTNLTVCSFSPKPAGCVVTSSYSSSNCAGTGISYTLVKITTQTSAVVCSFSPLPAGWVVSSYYPSSNCYGSGVAYSIRKA